MVTTLKICLVDPDPTRTAAFIHVHLRGGLWCLLAAEYYPAGFVGVRIFRSSETPNMFALIETWTSAESMEAARRTPAFPVLERFRRNLTLSSVECGAFAVPTAGTGDQHRSADSANPGAPTPIATPCTPPPDFDAPMQSHSAYQRPTLVRLSPVEALDEVRELPFPFPLLVRTILGTLLVASGTGTLNQYIERRFDALMRRTARRPLATGRITPSIGLAFGVFLAGLGGVYLAVTVSLLASELALFTLASYLLIYTPLKRKSPACTLIGAIPGAMPPLIGWAGASGHMTFEAWLLFGILFLWQLPHFMAIAWMYRDDYDRAGFCVLPLAATRRTFVNWMTVLPLIALVPLTLFPALFGHADAVYAVGTLVTSSFFLYRGSVFALHKSNQRARRLLFASIAYLPIVFALLITRAK